MRINRKLPSMKNIIRISGTILIIVLFPSCTKEDDNIIRDIDGNVYTSVTIGTQVWMVENLKTTRYRNGDLIGTTTPATLDITAEDSPKYQWAYDGIECAVATYGRLYTWYAVNDIREVCPIGWRVPNGEDWSILYFPVNIPIGSIGGADLMESGRTHWNRSDIMGTNKTGFTGLPSGGRSSNGIFGGITQSSIYWSSQESHPNSLAWFYTIPITYSYMESPLNDDLPKEYGLSIRCIKDNI